MGTTLIINPGSSSKKYALFQEGKLVVTWQFERSGEGFSVCQEVNATKSKCLEIGASEFDNALSHVVEEAVSQEFIASKKEITSIGIRIVAPDLYFTQHREIDSEFISRLTELELLAPHHIPSMLLQIERARSHFPEAKLIGVSDSAFHNTADESLRFVSMPEEDKDRFGIRPIGYHGLSVSSIVRKMAAREEGIPEKMIVCHIGSGVSVSAVLRGESAANSMGFTPGSGLMMSSRMGDLPADMLAAAIVRKNIAKKDIFKYLYDEGGFKGFTGVKDLRLVLNRADKHDLKAMEALTAFSRQVKNYIAIYAMLMGRVDTIVLTATAGVRNSYVRSLLVGHLDLLHTYIHDERNEALVTGEGYIHTDDSQTKILVLKTDELGEMHQIVSTFD